MEKTLSILKPDGVRKGVIGEVIKRFESNGIKVIAMKMLCLSKKEAKGFYYVHEGKPFYESLTDFMSSGPTVVMVLAGENVINKNREIMGATNPEDALPGTIRKDFASNVEQNIVHGSDSLKSAEFEISYFFNKLEICE
ncbi:MAG: nucleoside-diphosphate kinase [Thermodesulfobacteriota bacterium]|nr:nucleoside-diphosphate kinase [Thermodesulfobacteriota bacterium]